MRKPLAVAALVFVPLSYAGAEEVAVPLHAVFDVPAVTVRAGDTVVFANKDEVTHDIQIVDSGQVVDDKGLQKPGEEVRATFPAAGEYKVQCVIHPKAQMTVVVK